MVKGRIHLLAEFVALICLVGGLLVPISAGAEDYLTVSIPAVVGNSTTVEITAKNPAGGKRMGTIAVTIEGGGPVVPLNPKAYDVFAPGGPGRLATFRPKGEVWEMRSREEAVAATKMHVELYRDVWNGGAENTLRFPVTFSVPGAVRVLVRATFSKRVDGKAIVEWNLPKEGVADEQGLPCSVFELSGTDAVSSPGAQAQSPIASSPPVKTPEVATDLEAQYQEKAKEIVLSKSKKNVLYKVFQSLENGSLCTEGSWNDLLEDVIFDGDDFYWVDTSSAYTADDEKFRGDLYWCGTFNYTTVKDVPRTLNAFTTDLEKAIAIVRLNFGLYEEVTAEETDPSANLDTDVAVVGSGTGFFVTPEGHILTNHHVVSGGGVIAIIAEGQEPRIAEIVSMDEETDLALLKVDGPTVPVTFGSTDIARLGQTVFAIGYPSPDIQGVSPKVTMGIISSLTGLMNDIKSYQIDAAVQPGNSGGPLFNTTGEVIGVVFARINDAAYTQAAGAIAQQINYAIKNSHVMAFLQTQPEVYAHITRGTVGAQSQEEAVSRISKSVVLIVIFKEQE